jgi:hypothetical protein
MFWFFDGMNANCMSGSSPMSDLEASPHRPSATGPLPDADLAPAPPRARRALCEADAVDIWMARWLRVPLKTLTDRYACDSRRLYEVWWGQKFPESRAKAQSTFLSRFPKAGAHTVFGYRRIPRTRESDPRQARLFD